MTNLEARTTRLVPATLYSRMLAARATAASRVAERPTRGAQRRDTPAAAALNRSMVKGVGRGREPLYFRGRTASFSCFAIRAFTTVLAGILMASPVAGFRPMRALRF